MLPTTTMGFCMTIRSHYLVITGAIAIDPSPSRNKGAHNLKCSGIHPGDRTIQKETGRARIVRSSSCLLEHQPHVQLDQATRASCADISEMTFGIGLAIVDHTRSVAQKRATAVVHRAPLGVIESVERIRAELQFLALAERFESLLQSHIPIGDSGLTKVIPTFVTPSHCVVCDVLTEVDRIRAGGRLRVTIGVEGLAKAPAATGKVAIAGLDWNVPHAVV